MVLRMAVWMVVLKADQTVVMMVELLGWLMVEMMADMTVFV